MPHATRDDLDRSLPHVLAAPSDRGVLRRIVRRPERGEREVIAEGELDEVAGLVGDNWLTRGARDTSDGLAHPERQITLINVRFAAALDSDEQQQLLAGDQLHVDLDLSTANLPPGTRLRIGAAELEVTAEPHTGCAKFSERFGAEALRFVNSPVGRTHNLRGINARVVQGGTIRAGDEILKQPRA